MELFRVLVLKHHINRPRQLDFLVKNTPFRPNGTKFSWSAANRLKYTQYCIVWFKSVIETLYVVVYIRPSPSRRTRSSHPTPPECPPSSSEILWYVGSLWRLFFKIPAIILSESNDRSAREGTSSDTYPFAINRIFVWARRTQSVYLVRFSSIETWAEFWVWHVY
jgi:hypothetical protein